MGEKSGIAWTNDTFNPWWGCVRVSPGCEHCYAEQLATVRRKLPVWGVDAPRKPMSEAYWRGPLKWNREALEAGVRRRVFCASMADVFEIVPERNVHARMVQSTARARLWGLIALTPMLDWLLLTKRPENVAELAPWRSGLIADKPEWPSNVWLGTTAEDQKRADERLPILLSIPAAIRFVSHEPALERVDFWAFLKGAVRDASLAELRSPTMPGIDWIITGGESGSKARPYDLAWARSVVEQCRAAGIAPFVKQLGSNAHDSARSIVGGWCPGDPAPNTRVHGISGKAHDLAEWPVGLRVQEFPRSVAA